MMQPEWRIATDVGELVPQIVDALCQKADAAIVARRAFHLVLAGGNTPEAIYRELARRGAGDARWHIWFGDERCLPPDDPERNSAMAERAWLGDSRIPPAHRAPIPAEKGSDAAARIYAERLGQVGDFDLVLLGMGEDGHTASLFPGHPWGEAPGSPDVLAVRDAPKPPPDRVSLSAARLARSTDVWFVIAGSGKRHALRGWATGEALPVAAIRGRRETLAWVDALAWPADD